MMSGIKQFGGFNVVGGVMDHFNHNSNLQFKMSIKNKLKN